MAEWPDADELKRVLNYEATSGAYPEDDILGTITIPRVLASAIARVQSEVGVWAEDQEPTENQSAAALRMALLMAQNLEATPVSLSHDPVYTALLFGSRQRFGFS